MSKEKKSNFDLKKNTVELPVGVINKVRQEIRAWYGSLSVKEIISNKRLMSEIQKLEQLLSTQSVVV